jgi:hypothetical protein
MFVFLCRLESERPSLLAASNEARSLKTELDRRTKKFEEDFQEMESQVKSLHANFEALTAENSRLAYRHMIRVEP